MKIILKTVFFLEIFPKSIKSMVNFFIGDLFLFPIQCFNHLSKPVHYFLRPFFHMDVLANCLLFYEKKTCFSRNHTYLHVLVYDVTSNHIELDISANIVCKTILLVPWKEEHAIDEHELVNLTLYSKFDCRLSK